MKFNLAKHFALNVNLEIGNVPLDYLQLTSLLDLGTEPVAVMSENDILCLDVDLGERTKIDEIRYYFSSVSTSGTVASGIAFQYRNEFYESMMSSPTLIGDGYYYTTISGSSSPSFIRLNHTIASGTSISGSVYGYTILNDDTIINFGPDGNKTEFNTVATKGFSDIYTIPIYNSGTSDATAFIRLEPRLNKMDDAVSISNNVNGPWMGVKNTGFVIAGKDTWNQGTLGNNVTVYNNNLTLKHDTADILVDTMRAFNVFEGEYTTTVFSGKGLNEYSNIVILNTTSDQGSSIKIDNYDTTETINVRSNKDILKYDIYRKIYAHRDHQDTIVGYTEYHTDSEELIKQVNEVFRYYDYYGGVSDYLHVVNPLTGDSAGIILSNRKAEVFYLANNSSSASHRDVADTGNYSYMISIKDMAIDLYGGLWLYLYARYGNAGSDISKAGDYFLHYDKALGSPVLKLFDAQLIIGGFGVTPSSGNAWYTSIPSHVVFLLDTFGNTLKSYASDDLGTLGVCCMLSDGGCWFVNVVSGSYTNLLRLDSDAHLVSSLENISDTGNILAMRADGDEALWILDGFVLKRIMTTEEQFGRLMLSVSIPYPYRIFTTVMGCWVMSADGHAYFVDKFVGKITKHILPAQTSNERTPFAVYSEPGDGSVWDGEYPLSIDNSWTSMNYTKKPNNNYYVTPDYYTQINFKMYVAPPSKLYDNVSFDETWLANDDFSGSLNDRPAEHRWNYYDERIYIEDDRLLFKGSNTPNSPSPIFIDSYKKWYLRKYYNETFEFQVDYDVPESTVSGSVSISLSVNPNTTNNSKSDYYKVTIIRRPTEIEFKLSAHGNTRHGDNSYTSYNHSETFPSSGVTGSGKIKIRRDNESTQMLHLYHYDGTDWTEVKMYTAGYYYHDYLVFHYRRSLNINIEVDAARDVYIDNFIINDDVTKCYWYLVPPIIESVYLQTPVELGPIPPNDSRDLYMKVDVPDTQDFNIKDIYEASLLTWWEIKT